MALVTPLQRYIAEEIATDHVDGLLTRREALRRLSLLGIGAAAATSLIAACSGSDPQAAPSTATSAPPADASPPGMDSAVSTAAVTWAGPAGELQGAWAEAARPVSGGLRDILDSVIADPGADHSTAAMAGRAVVSERHLVRMFRDQVGMTPARFVEKARLEAAKVLLATSDHSQDAVARRAGFGTSDTLRRTFRRNLGVSPGVYRNRFRTTGIDQ